MFVLLVASSDSLITIRDIIGLSNSLSVKGHKVIVFFNDESVNLLGREREDLTSLQVGVRLKVCRTTASKKGLSNRGDFIIGVEMSSLGELVELMEEADRTVFL